MPNKTLREQFKEILDAMRPRPNPYKVDQVIDELFDTVKASLPENREHDWSCPSMEHNCSIGGRNAALDEVRSMLDE